MAAPVYGGLVAPVAVRRIARLRAENSIAIPVVVYGNRDYEDAWYSFATSCTPKGSRPSAVRLSWANTPTAVRACP